MSDEPAPARWHVRLRCVRALDDLRRCERYYEHHLELLRLFDMTGVTSLHPRWFDNPCAHMILVETNDGELLAGARVHVADGLHPLPTEQAYDLGPEVHRYVRDRLAIGVGETCGAWISRKVAKMGLFQVIICASFAVAGRLGIRVILGSCGDYTLKAFEEMGYVVETSLGAGGDFLYPTPDRVSHFVVVRDVLAMSDATADHRALVHDLCERPRQQRRHGALHVDVDLSLSQAQSTAAG